MTDDKILKLLQSSIKEDLLIVSGILESRGRQGIIEFFNKYGDNKYGNSIRNQIAKNMIRKIDKLTGFVCVCGLIIYFAHKVILILEHNAYPGIKTYFYD